MSIVYYESTGTFHLYNDEISYIMMILPNGQMGQLYFGKKVHLREDYSYLLEMVSRSMTSYVFENERTLSLEHIKQEYGVYGSSDYRLPAVEILQDNGSRICDFVYRTHRIIGGKPKLEGLPATYTEKDDEAQTLILTLGSDHRRGTGTFLHHLLQGRHPCQKRPFRQWGNRNRTSFESHESLSGSSGL